MEKAKPKRPPIKTIRPPMVVVVYDHDGKKIYRKVLKGRSTTQAATDAAAQAPAGSEPAYATVDGEKVELYEHVKSEGKGFKRALTANIWIRLPWDYIRDLRLFIPDRGKSWFLEVAGRLLMDVYMPQLLKRQTKFQLGKRPEWNAYRANLYDALAIKKAAGALTNKEDAELDYLEQIRQGVTGDYDDLLALLKRYVESQSKTKPTGRE